MNAPSPPSPSASPLKLQLVIATLTLVWGSTYFVIRQGLHDLPPFTSAALRFSIAAIVMAAVAAVGSRREGGRAPSLGLTLTLGTLNFGISYGLVYWAETRIPSGLVSVLWAVFPMAVALATQVFRVDQRLQAVHWCGFSIGFAGVVLLFSTDLLHLGRGAVIAGAILLLSPLVSAIGQVRIKAEGAAVSSLLLNRNAMAVGAVLLWGAALIGERDADLRFTPRAITSVLYLALMGTVLTFGLYYWAMRTAPAWKLSVIAYLTPALALCLGRWGGDEPVHATTLVGLTAILAGVALVLHGNRRPASSYAARLSTAQTSSARDPRMEERKP